jgi:hypothetical protein
VSNTAEAFFAGSTAETIETITEFYAAGNDRAVFMLAHKTPLPMLATDLSCKPNACIPTADEDEAKKDTHILCTDSNIASGTTGDCKCEENPDLAEPPGSPPGSPTAQSGSPSVYSVYSMFLVALSTLSFLV